MKKEYDTSVKEAIERVMSVFSEYIKTTPYFDIVWSGKVGYVARIDSTVYTEWYDFRRTNAVIWGDKNFQ